jgi:hypothetical protein
MRLSAVARTAAAATAALQPAAPPCRYHASTARRKASYSLCRNNIERRVAELSPLQMVALELMRAHFAGASCVELKQKAGTFRMDDATLLRFLHARKFDVGDAQQMLSNHLAWREVFAPGLDLVRHGRLLADQAL